MKQTISVKQPTLIKDALPSDIEPDLADVLIYLRDKLPGYRFQLALDMLFVDELLEDFPDSDVLEEVKTYRWYYEHELNKKNHRASIRRWMTNTKSLRRW
jgi:hypothetical protein